MTEPSEIFLTDTMRALQDVELAVDEDIMARSAAEARQSSRLLSSQPRVSTLDNPFSDIAERITSRRIRPILLELIHSLGHYIFALWSLTHPDSPCPWIIPSGGEMPAQLLRIWGSRTITAVSEGQREGYLPKTLTEPMLAFWRAEVEYGLQDVNQAVGKWKKQGEVFSTGYAEGKYGDVLDANALPDERKPESGNMARLLNDLEEVVWGDALPRSTDLAYDLAADFDPYAAPSEDDLISQPTAGASSILGNVFGATATQSAIPASPSAAVAHSRAVMDEVHAMPDLFAPSSPSPHQDTGNPHGDGEFGLTSRAVAASGVAYTNQGMSAVWVQRARASISAPSGMGGVAAMSGADQAQMSLEEVGRRRHEEWRASQREAAAAESKS
jgi:hypothetical protein